MAIQRLEEIPAVCENKACPDYGTFELVDVEDLDKEGRIPCPTCGELIQAD